ncbi:MAG TPA: FHA domain-containing protein [Chthoniobacter sp.]|jgi:hypothetical protein
MARFIAVFKGQASLQFAVKEPKTSIGSDEKNDIVLKDPSVEEFHALIHANKGRYLLSDLSGGRGTTINGKPVTLAELEIGDTIMIGSVLCRIQEEIPSEGPVTLNPQQPLPVSSHASGPSGRRGLPEEVRTLKEFYPDPAMRHRVHYDFAHRFLPGYVRQSPYAFFSAVFDTQYPVEGYTINRFIQSRWMMFEEMGGLIPTRPIGQRIFRRVLDLEISGEKMPYGPVSLIKMPPPEEVGEAILIGAVLLNASTEPKSWMHNVEARLFTFEKTFAGPEKGILCEWTPDSHLNHGLVLPISSHNFLEGIGRVLIARPALLPEAIEVFKKTITEQRPLLRPDGLMSMTFVSFLDGFLTYKETFSRPDNDAHICYISKVVPLRRLDPEKVKVTQHDRFDYWTVHYATKTDTKDICHLSGDFRLNGCRLSSDIIDVRDQSVALHLADVLKRAIRFALDH